MFVAVALPIITSGVEVILTLFEALKGKISVKLTKYNSEIQKIAVDLDDCGPAHQIGFVIPDESGDEYEDEDL